jgi:probable F420-dependent oxidoreductase
MARYRVVAMKIGLFAINYGTCADPELAVRVARHAEAAGFESVWAGEHVVLPDPAPPGFTMPPTLPLLDSIVGMTLVAARTTTIKVASGIIVLPLRNPVIVAKELASVDVVSNGRLIAGFAAGYVAAEFSAARVPMAGRGALMEDYIRAIRALWSMDKPVYQGRFVSFDGIDAHPRPRQRPSPPIVIGGEAPAALRRAVTMADGWYGFYLDVRETRRYVEELRRLAQQCERPAGLGRLELTVTPAGPLDKAAVAQYTELGIDRLVLLPQPDASPAQRHTPVAVDRILRNIDSVAQQIIGV